MKSKWRAKLRLWGKKRGGRMSGWWFIGSLGEASFFAAFFLLGVFSATTLVAWQLMSPNTQVIRIGYGFWLFFLVSISFIVLGTVGFWYRVLKVVTSDEHREVIAKRGIVPEPMVRKTKNILPPNVPDLRLFTDSPGAKLAFRLPSQLPENDALVAIGIFAMAWNAMIAIFLVFAVESLIRSAIPYRLLILLVPGIYVAIRSTQLFFRSFIRTLGIGSTTVEVEDLPLIPGNTYQLEVLQYGRLVIRNISVHLVCEEESTYHFGTDVRTERQVVFDEVIAEHGRDRIDWGYPLRMECQFTVPRDAMHSFQSFHNAIHWKIVVDGKANRWPSYSRSFPVVVYPANPRIPATVAS
ncbi:MAG: hypothetical protein ACK5AC_15945 [Planctomycetota bacterium]|jgi:hypothetical protein